MSGLFHRLRLILAGILVAVAGGAVAQIGSGSGLSSPPFDGRAESIISGELADARLSANVALLDTANSFAQTQAIDGAVPLFRLFENDQGADGGGWSIISSGGTFRLRTETDAGGSGENAINIFRTGVEVTTLQLNADSVQANGIEVRPPRRAYKAADTARTSTTTYADDPHLSTTVTAGGDYAIEAFLWVTTANGTSDFKFRFNESAGATACDGSASLMAGGSGTVSTTGFCSGVILNATGSGTFYLRVSGTLVDAPDTTVTLQWAQNVSDAGATTIKAGSWLRLTDL